MSTASRSEVRGSRVGTNSWATYPVKLVEAMPRMTPAQLTSWVSSSSWRPGTPPVWKCASHLMFSLDGADEIAFHDLHVIDVVEQFDALGRPTSSQTCDAPGGVVAHVVLVVALAVEELHADGDAVVFGDGFDSLEADDGVAGALFVGHAFAVAGEGDDVGDFGLGGEGDVFAEAGFDVGVVLDSVETFFFNFAAVRRSPWRCRRGRSGRGFRITGLEEIDAFEADLCGVGAEVVERDFLIAPAGDGLVDVVAAWRGRSGCGLRGGCSLRRCERVAGEERGCAGDSGLQDLTTCD